MNWPGFRDYKSIGRLFHGFVMALDDDFRKNIDRGQSGAADYGLYG
jgi:hypothetical protein